MNFRVLRLQAGHKYCLLGRLSKEVGWSHYDTIRVSGAPFFSFDLKLLVEWELIGPIFKEIQRYVFRMWLIFLGNFVLYSAIVLFL